MDQAMQSLQNGITDRQNELRNLVEILGKKGYRLSLISNSLRVLTIVLSAISAAKGVADKIYGSDSNSTLIIFTIVGMLTTIALGFEAAFKLEKRAVDLNALSATAQATAIHVDSEWRKNIGSGSDLDLLRQAARDLLTLQDAKLADIHQKAASYGVNLTIEVRALENPDDRPYLA